MSLASVWLPCGFGVRAGDISYDGTKVLSIAIEFSHLFIDTVTTKTATDCLRIRRLEQSAGVQHPESAADYTDTNVLLDMAVFKVLGVSLADSPPQVIFDMSNEAFTLAHNRGFFL